MIAISPLFGEEVEHGVERRLAVGIFGAGRARNVAEAPAEKGVADARPDAGDLDAAEAAAEMDEIVEAFRIEAHLGDQPPRARRVVERARNSARPPARMSGGKIASPVVEPAV